MLSDKDVLIQIERHKDLRREAEQDALVRQALAAQGKRQFWLMRAITYLTNRISDLRCWFLKRSVSVTGISRRDPCQST